MAFTLAENKSMTEKLAKRLEGVKPSPTLTIDGKTKALQAQGVDIINLSVGEPDFDTPQFIKEKAIEAIKTGFTKYTALDGILELKEAIIKKLAVDNQLEYEPNNISVSAGLKQSLYNTMQALLNEGDEVIIPSPYWVSYPDMTKLAGGTPVFIATTTSTRFKITADQLEKAITSKTRLLILNSPGNPSGMAYTLEELKQLGEVLRKYPEILIVSDDIYEYILWKPNTFANILNACPDLKSRTIIGNGVSKAYAMTGWRIGYIAAPEYIIKGVRKIQSQSTGCPNSIAQKAATVALDSSRDFFTPMLEAYQTRHDLVVHRLQQLEGMQCLPSDGTFYLFPDASAAIKQLELEDDIQLAEFLLEKAKVAVVPGTAFGMPNHIRISCATSEENLNKALRQISKVLLY